MKSPCELLFGENKFVVPPKLFGSTCFVRDHRPSTGKLDPRAVKCVFLGYSSSQQGYKCWSPSAKRMFVSMDVTFRESEPFYGEPTDLSQLFTELDHLHSVTDGHEGEKLVGESVSTNTDDDMQTHIPVQPTVEVQVQPIVDTIQIGSLQVQIGRAHV